MTRYELYFKDAYFKDVVDKYVEKHRTTYIGAFKSLEINEKYERRLCSINHAEFRRARNERI